MVHTWTPLDAVERWMDDYYMFDRSTRIAIIRTVRISRPAGVLWRSVTGQDNPAERKLIGYFPSLEMAAHVTWRMWSQRKQPVEDRVL